MEVHTKAKLVKILKLSGIKLFVVMNTNRHLEIKKGDLILQLEREIKNLPADNRLDDGSAFYNSETSEVKIFNI